MKNNFVAILDFGSSKVTCMAATKVSDNGDFVIKAVGQSSYSGFDDNAWYEPDLLDNAVTQAISQVENKMKSNIKEIYVGVPGAFCALATGEASLNFHSKKKMDENDVAEIIEKANIFKADDNVIPLTGKPVFYFVDGIIRTDDAVGVIGNKLTGLVSFSFMKKYFRNTVAPILLENGINRVHYVNVCEAQAGFISNTMLKSGYSIIIDVGHITTNVVLCGGNGLLFQRTFALGSGYLAGDLCQVLGCEFDFAMNVLEKVNLNLEVRQGDAYTVNGRMVDAAQTNEVVKARIAQIAEYIMRSFAMCEREVPSDTPVILTGGGLAYLRGGVDALSHALQKPIRLYRSVNPQTNRNEYTSSYGLIYEAIRNVKNTGGLLSMFRNLRKGDN